MDQDMARLLSQNKSGLPPDEVHVSSDMAAPPPTPDKLTGVSHPVECPPVNRATSDSLLKECTIATHAVFFTAI